MTVAAETEGSLLATTLGVAFADCVAAFAGLEVAGGVVAGFDCAKELTSKSVILPTANANRIFVRIIARS